MPASIRIIGSLNVDMVTVTPRFPGPGETITATSFTTSAGGKGANQAVACGRLSRSKPSSPSTPANAPIDPSALQIEMLGAVGQLDAHFPTLLQPLLNTSGVRADRIRQIPDEHTGVAVITVDSSAGGENRILFSPGANYSGMRCTEEVLGMSLAVPMPDVMVLQAEIPVETVVGILRGVRAWEEKEGGNAAGVDVVFNPAPAPEGGLPADVYKAIDHLIMNETECEIMAPKELDRVAGEESAATSVARRDKIARYFHSLGVRHVLVTLGAKGVWYSAGGVSGGEGERCTGEVPADKVEKVVDTTAAGDTFVGGYSVQIARWRQERRAAGRGEMDITVDERKAFMDKAVRWATRASARCVEREGAMASIPWEDEI